MEYNLNPKEQKKLNDAIDECVGSLFRQEGEVQFRKDVAARMKEELGFAPADFRSLVAERHTNKSTDAIEKHQEIVELNEVLTNNRDAVDNMNDDDVD